MQMESLEAIRLRLIDEKTNLLNPTFTMGREESISGRQSGDEADQAASEINLNLSLSLKVRERLLLQKIDRALEKIEQGNYGECESCGVDLNPKRLEARPVATLCLACKEEQEEKGKFYA